jgi:iron complex transport system ATP-binding protein
MSLTLTDIVLSRANRRLVDTVSLCVQPGQLTVLMGENGAGKSSLLKIAAGELTPDSGLVMLGDKPIKAWTSAARARCLAVLPQESNVAFMFSAYEVVLMGRSPHCSGTPNTIDKDIAHQALAKLDVAHLANRLFPTLSGGERARVSLARVLAQLWQPIETTPRCLLLDEPVAALDIAHQHLALQVARAFAHDEGATVVAVLHDLNLAAQYADNVVLMKAGRIQAQGSVAETLTESILSQCFSTVIRRMAHPDDGRPLLYAA